MHFSIDHPHNAAMVGLEFWFGGKIVVEIFWFAGEGWMARFDGGDLHGPFTTYREASQVKA